MTDDDKLEKAMGQGARADALLRSDAFCDAVAAVRQALMDRWLIAKDASERERIWLAVNLIEQVRGALASAAGNGKLAQRELDEIATGRRRRFGL